MTTKYCFTDIVNNTLPKSLSISGIYCIYNAERRVYVGSSIDILKRIKNHYWDLKRNKHKNPPLQRAFLKYPFNNFCFTILEIVEDKHQLFPREAYWISEINPRYNMEQVPSIRPDKSQYWIICTPEDKWMIIKNLKEFCRDNNLNNAAMQFVANGKQKSYKGWFCRRPTPYERDRLIIERFTKTSASIDRFRKSGVMGILWVSSTKRWNVFSPWTPREYVGTNKDLNIAKNILESWLTERGLNIQEYLIKKR